MRVARLLLPILTASLIVACEQQPPEPDAETAEGTEAPALTAEDVALNNRGVAQMGQFEYAAAHDTFKLLAEKRPDWATAQTNLAIATLNRQEEGDEVRALEIALAVLETHPEDLRAHYIAGLMNLYQGQTADAESHFRTVVEADPDDAHARYFLGQSLAQLGRHEEAAELYQAAIERDPYLRSAYYGAAQTLRRLGDRDGARSLLQDYQRFADNPRAHLAEFKYTRMGPKAEALSVGLADPEVPALPDGPVFGTPVQHTGEGSLPADAGLTTVDIDGDGHQDLFITGARSQVYLADEEGGFTATEHPLAGIEDVHAAAWGDVDNDGNTDAFLCRGQGPSQLWLQRDDGSWEESAAAHGIDVAPPCGDALLVDADHDGDLDIFVLEGDGLELFNNDMDGSFRRLAEDHRIGASETHRGRVLAGDLDADGDLDLVSMGERGGVVFVNDRLWEYRSLAFTLDGEQSRNGPAVIADLDADGRSELFQVAHRADADSGWTLARVRLADRGLTREPVAGFSGVVPEELTVLDVDGDGTLELRAANADHRVYLRADGQRDQGLSEPYGGPMMGIPVLRDAGGGPSFVGIHEGALVEMPPGPGRYGFLSIGLSGKEESAESMRSNRSAIGARVVVREDSRWTIQHHLDAHSAPGQSLQPMAVGTRGAERLDYIEIHWPDGVFQTELALEAGRHHEIAETQRQLSSCPVVFAWDGEGYGFVSDILGVGGIGFLVAPGEYAEPRPWERFLMPEGSLVPKDGHYEIKITEPMQEVAYLDSAALVAWDLPPGWDMVLDERMATGAPEPTGEPIFFREAVTPARAVNDRGEDVTETVVTADRRAAPPGEADRRFIGRTREPHALTLEFDAPISGESRGEDRAPVLVAEGWVEYPYSQTVFAAWQAEASYDPATIEYRTADGDWQVLHERFGYPAGMPRTMALPLEGLPAGVTALRLSSNLELYWDRIRVAFAEPASAMQVEPKRRELSLASARLAKTGFPRRSTGEQRLPDYDYGDRSPFWDTQYPEGFYTALGPIRELVAESDDALVTVGPGEEAHLAFTAEEAELPRGWSRRLVLDTRGWAKDMDLYTASGGTVGPLPAAAPGDRARMERRERLHEETMVRYQGGR